MPYLYILLLTHAQPTAVAVETLLSPWNNIVYSQITFQIQQLKHNKLQSL